MIIGFSGFETPPSPHRIVEHARLISCGSTKCAGATFCTELVVERPRSRIDPCAWESMEISNKRVKDAIFCSGEITNKLISKPRDGTDSEECLLVIVLQ